MTDHYNNVTTRSPVEHYNTGQGGGDEDPYNNAGSSSPAQQQAEFYVTELFGGTNAATLPQPQANPVKDYGYLPTTGSSYQQAGTGSRPGAPSIAPRPAAVGSGRALPMTPTERQTAFNTFSMPDAKRQGDKAHPAGFEYSDKKSLISRPKVQYLKDKRMEDVIRREKLRVELDKTIKRGGKVFDTREVISRWDGKTAKKGNEWVERASVGGNSSPVWAGGGCIWVCVKEGDNAVFYSHICKKQKFHHSTFVAGGAVIGAGEWVISGGKLLSISAASGHYRPSLISLRNVLVHLRLGGALSPDTTVLVFDLLASAQGKYVTLPVADFVKHCTDSRYKPDRWA